MRQRKIIIAVIGAREPSPEAAAVAEQVGKEMALKGAVLVCGGLGGIMEAACRGAASENGLTIGILPGTDPDDANPYVQIPIATGTGLARNMAVVQTAGAVVAIDGSYGTLSEIAYARAADVPVIGLDTWHITRKDNEDTSIIRVDTPQEAVNIAISMAENRQGRYYDKDNQHQKQRNP